MHKDIIQDVYLFCALVMVSSAALGYMMGRDFQIPLFMMAWCFVAFAATLICAWMQIWRLLPALVDCIVEICVREEEVQRRMDNRDSS